MYNFFCNAPIFHETYLSICILKNRIPIWLNKAVEGIKVSTKNGEN